MSTRRLSELIEDQGWFADYLNAREAWNVFKKRILLDSDMFETLSFLLEPDAHGGNFSGFNLRIWGPEGAYVRITAPTLDKHFTFDSGKMPNAEMTFSVPVGDRELSNRLLTIIWGEPFDLGDH